MTNTPDKQPTTSIDRWDYGTQTVGPYDLDSMVKSPDGDYVKYEDFSELEAENERLKKEVDFLKWTEDPSGKLTTLLDEVEKTIREARVTYPDDDDIAKHYSGYISQALKLIQKHKEE